MVTTCCLKLCIACFCRTHICAHSCIVCFICTCNICMHGRVCVSELEHSLRIY
ncbi:uncharacterized protein ASCRUDRAFT_102950 [Ascoidea rubescens DSM 1968]|uniref:Uncharacterized protein n=1 Tax=Ascoidea rubescens DSM 1968 TaxID=1344418 RepID=A0A1D2VRA4_9ASCO|nr:hypothetical protein ASCRUDRAFT_102950 [Ascoidea rubescens DSM 1968]ODV64144.1 hypothetical protein ASCRUDRAFT_102950 [Ascoidea rubescens DSM 1968]